MDENGKRYGYKNQPLGKEGIQNMFDYAIYKTVGIKNKFKKGETTEGKTLFGRHYPVGQWRKSIITLLAGAGLGTSQIQTYSLHASASMVDVYVKKHLLANEKTKCDARIRNFIDPSHNKASRSFDRLTLSRGEDMISQSTTMSSYECVFYLYLTV